MALPELKSRTSDTSQSIIDGALFVMAERGLQQLTTKRVSAQADVSTAAIHYFFETKDRLIYETFAHVIRRVRGNILAVRRSEPNPLLRLRKTMDVFFETDQTTGPTVKVWPQFWVHAGLNPQTARLFQIYNSRMISNFTADLIQIGMTRKDAKANAYRLNALHRGLWIDIHIGNNLSVDDARKNYNTMIDNFPINIDEENA